VPILPVCEWGKHWLALLSEQDYFGALDTTQLERYGMSNTQPKLSQTEEQNFTSLGNILGILIGFLSPLIFWLIYKDRSSFLDSNLKSALNFHLTMIIPYIVGSILVFAFIGSLIALAALILTIVFSIVAFSKTRNGENYTYPLSIPFVK
jgi:uncharacterized Tic20 family protein